MKGLEQRGFNLELGQWSPESKLWLIEVMRVSSIIQPPPGCVPYFLQNSQTSIRLFSVSLEDKASVFSLNVVFWLLFLCSCISSLPLTSSINETSSGISIVAGFRSQNDLGQNGFPYVKKTMLGSLSPATSYPICLQNIPSLPLFKKTLTLYLRAPSISAYLTLPILSNGHIYH